MIFLRDVKLTFNRKYILLGLFFGILGVLSPIISQKYGVGLSIFFFILTFFFTLFANRFQKHFEGLFEDKISIKDSLNVVLRDKDGNIKEERNQ